MAPNDLSDEFLEAVHAGASPIPSTDRRAYYNLISRWLDATVALTPVGLRDAILAAQRQLLRPPPARF
jgi:hypothetical protein